MSRVSLEDLLRDPALARLRVEAERLDVDVDDLQHDRTTLGDAGFEAQLRDQDARVAGALSRAPVEPEVATFALATLRAMLADSLATAIDAVDLAPTRTIAFLRLLQTRLAGLGPIRTEPHFTYYEWAGPTLAALHGLSARPAESWPFFSGRAGIGPASLRDSALASAGHALAAPITLRDLVRRAPAILGPAGADPEHEGEKAFFVKLLDPSSFPPFAWVGFDPAAVARFGGDEGSLRSHLLDLLVRERESIARLRDLLAPAIRSEDDFVRLREAYKAWAVDGASSDWHSPAPTRPLTALAKASGAGAEIEALLGDQIAVRRRITGLLHRIELAPGRAVLVPSPTLHGIAGMSGQMHPRRPGSFFPKDEAWIQVTLGDASGTPVGWALVEPQRTFDRTESAFDFFTPFAWGPAGLVPRKAIGRRELEATVAGLDARPRPAAEYLRTTAALHERVTGTGAHPDPTDPTGATAGTAGITARVEGDAAWWRIVDEPSWPHFAALELRVGPGGGAVDLPPPADSFVELHVTSGTVRASFGTGRLALDPVEITARDPLLLPATLAATGVRLESSGPARLMLFLRPAR